MDRNIAKSKMKIQSIRVLNAFAVCVILPSEIELELFTVDEETIRKCLDYIWSVPFFLLFIFVLVIVALKRLSLNEIMNGKIGYSLVVVQIIDVLVC